MKHVAAVSIAIICMIFSLAAGMSAQWKDANGPVPIPWAPINSLTVIGTDLYVGTDAGLYLTPDKGLTWTAVNAGLTNLSVTCIAASGTNIYAGTQGGIFLSTNRGSSWKAIDTDLSNTFVTSLVVKGTTLYAGTNGGMFRSTTNGAHWEETNTGLTNTTVRAVLIKGTTLFAGTAGGVFRSTNSGSNWTLVNDGLTNTSVTKLAVSGGNVIAGTKSGIFLSANDGISWTAMNGNLVLPGKEYLYPNVYDFAVNDSVIYVTSYPFGVSRTVNNGASWTALSPQFQTNHPNTLALDPDGTIYAGMYFRSVYKSSKNFDNWMRMDAFLANSIIRSISSRGNSLYVASDAGVGVSMNEGNTWTGIPSPENIFSVSNIAAVDSNVFVSVRSSSYFGTYGYGSTNNGATWFPVTGDCGSISFFTKIDTNIIVASPSGLSRLINSGAKWTSAYSGVQYKAVTALASVKGTEIVATEKNGFYYSVDRGITWTSVNSLSEPVYTLAVIDTVLFAGTPYNGVFRSTDKAASWTKVSNGLTNGTISSLVADSAALYAGTPSGIFVSTDRGTQWKQYNQGLPVTQVNGLCIHGTYLYAAISDHGLWKRTLSELVTAVEHASGAVPTQFTLDQNYPNPFNPTTMISFSLPVRSTVSLKIFDVMGREVATVVSEEMQAGSYSRQWNASAYPSGIYFYRLQAGASTETKRLVLLK